MDFRVIKIYCDWCGTHQESSLPKESKKFRQELKKDGWISEKSDEVSYIRDFCSEDCKHELENHLSHIT